MNLSRLLSEEKAYLLGIYLADGYMRKRHKPTHELRIHLQGNEMEIADKIINMFRRSGLNPRLEKNPREYELTVIVTATNLVSLFPEKKKLFSLPASRLRRWAIREHLYGDLGIPFIAGLLDGDGSCYVGYDRSSLLNLTVKWSLFQSNCQFLSVYLKEHVNKLVLGGSTLAQIKSRGRKEGAMVTILKSGREVLLRNGIAKWSFKVNRFVGRYEAINRQKLELTSSFLRTGQVAIRLNVSAKTIENWCRKKRIKHLRISSIKSSYCRYLVPLDEVQKLEVELAGIDKKV
jgi:hypothetical protein